MKFRIFALLLTLALMLTCFSACGGADSNKGNEADTKTENNQSDTGSGDTGAITGGVHTPMPDIEGGVVTLSYEIVDAKLILTATVSENPGFASYYFEVNYDNTKVSPVGFLDSELVIADDVQSNIRQTGVGLSELTYVSAFYVGAENVSGDGTICKIEFDILPEAAENAEFILENVEFTTENIESAIFTVENCTATFN